MNKSNTIFSILILFSVCVLVVVFTVNCNICFDLVGSDTITVEINSNYIEEGYTARIFNNDLGKYVVVKNNVDTSNAGTYYINYYLTYMGNINKITRTVIVTDSNKE